MHTHKYTHAYTHTYTYATYIYTGKKTLFHASSKTKKNHPKVYLLAGSWNLRAKIYQREMKIKTTNFHLKVISPEILSLPLGNVYTYIHLHTRIITRHLACLILGLHQSSRLLNSLSICLSVLSVHLSICPSVCPFVCPSVRPSVRVSVCPSLSMYTYGIYIYIYIYIYI
jgi:hypothetical protein